MKTIDLARWAMRMTDESTSRLVEDMRDEPLTRTTSRDGNHSLWIIGHLATVEGSIPQILFGEPNPVQHWWALFGPGSTPSDNAAAYPSFDEVLTTYHELRTRNLARLEGIGEAGLDATPVAVPPGFEDEMRTVGQTFMVMALHQMFHLGQVADSRRAAGKRPYF